MNGAQPARRRVGHLGDRDDPADGILADPPLRHALEDPKNTRDVLERLFAASLERLDQSQGRRFPEQGLEHQASERVERPGSTSGTIAIGLVRTGHGQLDRLPGDRLA